LAASLEPRGIIIEELLVRNVELPKNLADSIESKLQAEQDAQRMTFVLEKEEKESERKIIEAGGIAKAQDIINKTLTDAYLQHEAIMAQMKMADSPNHTTVYIPVGFNGLPLVKTIPEQEEQK
jgi:regulator of protease activity HflC (stomatin/prohibitin superfamily)